ncbi:MAG: hypothetical protein QM760_17570 [Nibricoccus sp.]
MFCKEFLGLFAFTGEDEFAGFADRVGCFGIGGIVGSAGPDGVVVELDAVAFDAAVDHGAETTAAERQGFDPFACGLAVPHLKIASGTLRGGIDRWWCDESGAAVACDDAVGCCWGEIPCGGEACGGCGAVEGFGDFVVGEDAAVDGEGVDFPSETVVTVLVGTDAQRHAFGGREDFIFGRCERGDALAVDEEGGDFVGRAKDADDVRGVVGGNRFARGADERRGCVVLDLSLRAHAKARAEQCGGAEEIDYERACRAVSGRGEPEFDGLGAGEAEFGRADFVEGRVVAEAQAGAGGCSGVERRTGEQEGNEESEEREAWHGGDGWVRSLKRGGAEARNFWTGFQD